MATAVHLSPWVSLLPEGSGACSLGCCPGWGWTQSPLGTRGPYWLPSKGLGHGRRAGGGRPRQGLCLRHGGPGILGVTWDLCWGWGAPHYEPSQEDLKHLSFLLQTLKNSKSLSSLDCEGEDDDDPRAKTAVSRPRDPHGLVTPGSSPYGLRELVASEGGGSGDPSAWDSAWEEGVLPLDPGALDLEQIENN